MVIPNTLSCARSGLFRDQPFGIIAIGVFSLMGLLGCTVVDHSPKQLAFQSGQITGFSPGSPVKLTNAQSPTSKVSIETRQITVNANYHDYTAALIDLIRTEIEKYGGKVSPAATKEVKLAVTNVTLTRSLVDFFCTVDATVALGKGRIFGVTSRSAGGATAAIDTALVNLAASILNEQRVRSYLEQR